MNLTPRGSSIITADGTYVDPLNFTADDFDPEVAHRAMANINRFTGHTIRPWSVARHTLLVHGIVSDQARYGRPVRTWAYIHDMAEAYLGDVARPIKNHPSMSPFREAEDRILETLCHIYGLDVDMPDGVRWADDVAVCIEALNLLPPGATKDWVMPYLQVSQSFVFQSMWREIDDMPDATVLLKLAALERAYSRIGVEEF